jgi:predicted GNAT superfamily acetyltransferase
LAGGQTLGIVSAIEVRPLAGLDEFGQAVDLQRVVWQFEDLDLLPVRLFVVAQKVGGQALGAFQGGRLIGFCLAIPGVRDGRAYLHSHMLGVRPEFRNRGAGAALKLAQRDDALPRGLDLIEWTFDPLELKNAFFNIDRLGAVVTHFVPNQYGVTTSKIQAGLPTDRCTAQWWIRRGRFQGTPVGRVSVPVDIDEIKRSDLQAAHEIQARVSRDFQDMLGKGYAAIGFERTPDAGVYLFAPWHCE